MEEKSRRISLGISILNIILLSVITLFTVSGAGRFSLPFFAVVTVYLLAVFSDGRMPCYAVLCAPVISYFILLLLKRDPVFSLSVFLPYFFPVALYALVIKRGLSRGIVLTVNSAAVTLLLTLSTLITAKAFTSPSLAAIKSFYAETIVGIENTLNRAFTISIAGQNTPTIPADYMETLIDGLIMFAPAAVYFAVYSICFFCSSAMYQRFDDSTDDDIYERWIIKTEPSAFASIAVLTALAFVISNRTVFSALVTTDVIIWTGVLYDGASSSFRKKEMPGGMYRRPFVRPALLIILGLINIFTVPVTAAFYAGKDCANRLLDRGKEKDSEETEDRS